MSCFHFRSPRDGCIRRQPREDTYIFTLTQHTGDLFAFLLSSLKQRYHNACFWSLSFSYALSCSTLCFLWVHEEQQFLIPLLIVEHRHRILFLHLLDVALCIQLSSTESNGCVTHVVRHLREEGRVWRVTAFRPS